MSWLELNNLETEATGNLTQETRCFVMSISGGYLLRIDKTTVINNDGQALFGGPVFGLVRCTGVVPARIAWGSATEATTHTGDLQTIKTRTYTGVPRDGSDNPLPNTVYRIERFIEADGVPPVAVQVQLVFI